MLKKTLPIILFLIFFSSLIAPVALAQSVCYCYCNSQYKTDETADQTACETVCGTQSAKCGVKPTTSSNQIVLTDPLAIGKAGPAELYARIIGALLAFVGIASLVAFIYAGFVFLVSAGSPEKTKKAKDTMLYAVIGVFVAMASYAILSFIFKTLETATTGQ